MKSTGKRNKKRSEVHETRIGKILARIGKCTRTLGSGNVHHDQDLKLTVDSEKYRISHKSKYQLTTGNYSSVSYNELCEPFFRSSDNNETPLTIISFINRDETVNMEFVVLPLPHFLKLHENKK